VVILLLGIAYFFKEPIILFLSGDPALLDVAKPAVVIYMLLYAFGNVSQIVSGYYMSVQRNGLAILNGIARMTVFAVPLIFILPKFFGVDGVWMAQPVADTLSCVLALVCMTFEYKRLGVRQKEGEAISVTQLDTVSSGLD
jgi:Na+-driven multidrug efflux pump